MKIVFGRRAALAKYLFGGIVFVILILLAAEILMYFVWNDKPNPAHETLTSKPAALPDSERCYVFVPSAKLTFDFDRGKKNLFRTRTTIDAYGRRIDGSAILFGAQRKFVRAAVFFGGSDVFGVGLPDRETLPSQFVKLAPWFRTYNYGHPGSGPNQMLALLRRKGFQKEISEKELVFIYVTIPSHIRRSIGSMELVSSWFDTCKDYVFDDKGEILAEGTYASLYPSYVRLAKFLRGTRLGGRIMQRWGIPPYLLPSHVRHYLFSVKAAAEATKRSFPGSRFLVVMLGRGDPEAVAFAPFTESLREAKIDYINASHTNFPTLEYDSHLNGEGYAQVARLIFDHLERTKE